MEEKIKTNLQEIAFDMFRDFTKSVTENHPNLKIHINNETELVNDLINTINKAKNELKNKEDNEATTENYQIGFMLGFIKSNLNTKWTYEYVIKQTNEYKEFIAIKSLSLFLKQDKLHQIKANAIYDSLILSDINLMEIDVNIEKKLIGEEELDNLTENIDINNVLQMLENKINNYIADYLNNEKPVYVWPIVKYFSNKGILQLIATEIN